MITSELQSLPSENRRLFMLRKATTNKETNICYKKHQYVFNNICKVSTHRNFSQHDDILSRLIGDIFEIIYLQIYHIYILYYIYTYKQPANRNIYFCNKKSTNFWNDRTIRFRRTKAVSFIFQVMCIQQKDV